MSVELDSVMRVGAVATAAVTETRVCSWHSGRALSFYGAKRPLAVLVSDVRATRAFDVDGKELGLETFDARYPRQRDEFERRMREGE